MKISSNKLIGLGLGLVVVLALAYAFAPKPVDVDLAPVRRGALVLTVDEDGKTRIKERYAVSAPLTGRLLRIALKAGDTVKAGETLLAILEPADPALLDARTRAEAEARVKAAEAARNRARPVLERARSNHDFARTDLQRVRELAATGVASRQALDDTELRERNTAEEMRAAEYALQIAEFELEQAQAALLRTRPEVDPAAAVRFEIRSPIDGRVLRVFQESATVVSPGIPLLELGNPDDLEVEADVLSADAVRINPGAKVFLEHWGGPNPLLGRVRLVEPAAFTKISALGVEEQRVWVIIDFLDPPSKRRTLGDAYRVEARIVIGEKEDILKVPASALFRLESDWAVFVAEGRRSRLRRVEIGMNNGLEAEVLAHLRENERVVLHPGDRIRDGVAIRARPNGP